MYQKLMSVQVQHVFTTYSRELLKFFHAYSVHVLVVVVVVVVVTCWWWWWWWWNGHGIGSR